MHFYNIAVPVIAALTAMQGTTAPIAAKAAVVGAKAAAKSVGKGLAAYGVTSGRVGTAVGIAGFGCSVGDCGRKMKRTPTFINVKKSDLVGRQDRPAPPEGINQHDWDNCIDALDGTVEITGPVGVDWDGIEVRGLPAVCMPLVSWFIGNPQDNDIIPVTCGDDCVRYVTLTEEDYGWVKEVFEELGAL
ncbi:hypothetical protein CkaCkLH20_04975 [Colletotrichum karsti]|uniref:Uncharacterized protein n=1 Tax=Colletotrichum karsti TaxID=1095194 RepID=A0A9P6LLI7_9PEZI|nr:uncharacterized protein CkaCkLH20_04975 [Colletotrichum karsti]KAF9877275.1 hypothetical protein CkaCkLH20_04975 [Colletotrichum karsti]